MRTRGLNDQGHDRVSLSCPRCVFVLGGTRLPAPDMAIMSQVDAFIGHPLS